MAINWSILYKEMEADIIVVKFIVGYLLVFLTPTVHNNSGYPIGLRVICLRLDLASMMIPAMMANSKNVVGRLVDGSVTVFKHGPFLMHTEVL